MPIDDDMFTSNRRKFLRGLASLGVTASTASLLTQSALADSEFDPGTEVPRVHGFKHTNHEEVVSGEAPPKREPVIGTISREKWALVESANDVVRRIENGLSDVDFDPHVAVGRRVSGQRRQREIIVEHRTLRSADGKVVQEPDLSFDEFADLVKDRFGEELTGVAGRGSRGETAIEGIPITVEETDVTLHSSYDYPYRDDGSPAGCYVDAGEGGFTLGPPALDGNSFRFVFISAGHTLGQGYDGSGGPHDEIYQNTYPWSSHEMGAVSERKFEDGNGLDAGVIYGLEFGVSWKFAADADNFYQGPEIFGSRSQQYIDDIGWGYEFYKQGIANGREKNSLGPVGTTRFESSHDGSPGDSGGPYWDLDDDGDAMIWGIHKGEGNPWSSRGTMIEPIENQFNLTV